TPSAIAALVNGDTLATMEDLDRPACRANVDLLADEAVRHGIEEALELDMVVGGDAGQTPFGELVVLHRQAAQHGAFHGLEQMAPADAKTAHDMVVDALECSRDR